MHDSSVHAMRYIVLFPRQPYPGRGDSPYRKYAKRGNPRRLIRKPCPG
jgi:hypothetical protein